MPTASANMSLPIPVVGIDSGPQWADSLNSCLTIVDAHDHSAGNGVQITPGGLNINSDLTFSLNNATSLRSVRFAIQPSALALSTDLGCLYEVGVDLYYNDGSGNQVRLTQSGAVAGTPGSISNLVSPASASYSSGSTTFVFKSAATTSAYIDGASILLRNLTANSYALTLAPPNAMGANSTIVLPTLPVSGTKFVSLDSSGNMGAAWAVDGSTLEVSSNAVQIKALGVGTTQLAAASVTRAKQAALGQTVGPACTTFTSTNTNYAQVTNLGAAIVSTGRPVEIRIIPDGSGSGAAISLTRASGNNAGAYIAVQRDNVSIAEQYIYSGAVGATSVVINTPVSAINYADVVAAGSYTYRIAVKVDSGTSATFSNCKLMVYEIG